MYIKNPTRTYLEIRDQFNSESFYLISGEQIRILLWIREVLIYGKNAQEGNRAFQRDKQYVENILWFLFDQLLEMEADEKLFKTNKEHEQLKTRIKELEGACVYYKALLYPEDFKKSKEQLEEKELTTIKVWKDRINVLLSDMKMLTIDPTATHVAWEALERAKRWE